MLRRLPPATTRRAAHRTATASHSTRHTACISLPPPYKTIVSTPSTTTQGMSTHVSPGDEEPFTPLRTQDSCQQHTEYVVTVDPAHSKQVG